MSKGVSGDKKKIGLYKSANHFSQKKEFLSLFNIEFLVKFVQYEYAKDSIKAYFT